MSSLMGLRGYPMRSAYTATKFAVIGITEAVAQEVG
jgi:NAD(P)-dependent dehydrogenase (short-subunit alcohol dehydrogenase family)